MVALATIVFVPPVSAEPANHRKSFKAAVHALVVGEPETALELAKSTLEKTVEASLQAYNTGQDVRLVLAETQRKLGDFSAAEKTYLDVLRMERAAAYLYPLPRKEPTAMQSAAVSNFLNLLLESNQLQRATFLATQILLFERCRDTHFSFRKTIGRVAKASSFTVLALNKNALNKASLGACGALPERIEDVMIAK